MTGVRIVDPDPAWPEEFARSATRIRGAVGTRASRIDHIGSTSVPELPAKDVIDIQVSVPAEEDVSTVAFLLRDDGWVWDGTKWTDHLPPGGPADLGEWLKAFLHQPEGWRRAHVHVRVDRSANARYALLFRDYLRSHPATTEAYGELKRRLAALGLESGTYADAKDPACDLIYLAAQAWASQTEWMPNPSDA